MMGWITLGLIVAAIAYVIYAYNALVRDRNRFENAFAQIDVQLQRRHDLIPNLVETAKGYLEHERETLQAVTEARNSAVNGLRRAEQSPGDPSAMRELSQSEGALSGALGRLFALSESYPDLKANQNMMQLTEELTTTENRIAYARQGYNDAVMRYNTRRESFPGNIIANNFGFDAAELLEIEDEAKREVPQVSF